MGVVWVECVQICGLHAVVLGGNAEAKLRSCKGFRRGGREDGGGRDCRQTEEENGDFWMQCLPQFVGSGLCLRICTAPRL